MARKLRVEYPGAMYHVIQRGNNKERVFERPEDKYVLIEQLRKAVAVDEVELFAYVVMNNHYHLALRTLSIPLNKVMHRINTKYSMFHNKAMGRTGHVFDGRYKSILIQDEKYLLSLVKYIHRNPVRAGLCSNVRDYTWSSDCYYRKTEPGFIEISLLLDILSEHRVKSIKEYDLFMSQDDSSDCEALIKTDSANPKNSVGEQKIITRRKSLDEILMESVSDRTEYEYILNSSRMRRFFNTKTAYAKSAWEQGYSMQEIASYINVSVAAVFKYLKCWDDNK